MEKFEVLVDFKFSDGKLCKTVKVCFTSASTPKQVFDQIYELEDNLVSELGRRIHFDSEIVGNQVDGFLVRKSKKEVDRKTVFDILHDYSTQMLVKVVEDTSEYMRGSNGPNHSISIYPFNTTWYRRLGPRNQDFRTNTECFSGISPEDLGKAKTEALSQGVNVENFDEVIKDFFHFIQYSDEVREMRREEVVAASSLFSNWLPKPSF